jgi:hypothetical protein
VSIYLLDQSKLKQDVDSQSADLLSKSSTYIYADGDPVLSTKVIVTRRDDPKQGLVHMTVRLETLQTVEVDSEVTEQAMCAATIGLSMPGVMEDTDKALSLLGSAFSLFFNGVTTKVPNSGIIDSMNFGLVNDLY